MNNLGISRKCRFWFYVWSVRFCISDKLVGDADAAGPLTILWAARDLQGQVSVYLSRSYILFRLAFWALFTQVSFQSLLLPTYTLIREDLCSDCSLSLQILYMPVFTLLASIHFLDHSSIMTSSEVSSLTCLFGCIPLLIPCTYPWWHLLQMQCYIYIINWSSDWSVNPFIHFFPPLNWSSESVRTVCCFLFSFPHKSFPGI